jgi:hypothetical protein
MEIPYCIITVTNKRPQQATYRNCSQKNIIQDITIISNLRIDSFLGETSFMARIADSEIKRLKNEVGVDRLIESS